MYVGSEELVALVSRIVSVVQTRHEIVIPGCEGEYVNAMLLLIISN